MNQKKREHKSFKFIILTYYCRLFEGKQKGKIHFIYRYKKGECVETYTKQYYKEHSMFYLATKWL